MRIPKRVDAAGVELGRGERALIRAEIVGGKVIATNQALHIANSQSRTSRRIEWWRVKRASFDPTRQSLRVITEDDDLRLDLPEPTLLAEMVRERVTATILTSITFAPPG